MKRIIAIISVAAIIAGTIPAYAIDSVTITPKTAIASSKLTAKVAPADADVSYQWLASDTEEGEYTPILGATGNQYIYTTIDKNKYITVEVTDKTTGDVSRSADIRTSAKLGPVSIASLNKEITPAENIFVVDGKSFILLDKFNDESSAYYVMTEDVYGTKAFDTDAAAKFDTESTNNIGYYLNNDFITEGELPQSVADSIDRNHIWWTEAGIAGGDCEDDYSVTCGINLISMSEAVKYQTRFGCSPAGKEGSWWIRTQRGRSGLADNIMCITGKEGGVAINKMTDVICTAEKQVRPVFYLNSGFFKDTKLEVEATGSEIKELILDKYTKEEMSEIYSPEELAVLGYASEPGTVVKGAVITADSDTIGAEVTLKAEMDMAGAQEYRYQWIMSKDPSEGYSKIRGAKSETYYITTIDKGCYLNCEITPISDGEEMGTYTAKEPIFVENLGFVKANNFTLQERTDAMHTPEENKFSLNGSDRSYILLDSFNDKKAEFFVMADYETGPIEADSEDPGIIDPETPGNIGYWLTNNFGDTGYEIAGIHKDGIEDEIKSYVDKDHEWWCEAGIYGYGDTNDDYSFIGPYSVLSHSEGIKYYGVYGWSTATEHGGWALHYWTRTSSDKGDSFFSMTNGAALNDSTGNYAIRAVPPITGGHEEIAPRPVFYLSHDFFLKADLSFVGDNVKKAIRESYTLSELIEAGFTVEKLASMGWIGIPSAEDVAVKGAAKVGAELFGSYTYMHSTDTPEGATECGFEISDKLESGYKPLCKNKSYVVTSDAQNKFIRFYVHTKDTDSVSGSIVYSKPVYVYGKAEIVPVKAEIVTQGGGRVTSLSNTAAIRAEVVLKNITNSDKNVTIMLWLYDRNNNALGNKAITVKLGAGKVVNVDTPVLSTSRVSNGAYARMYIIDDLSEMNSILTSPVEVR